MNILVKFHTDFETFFRCLILCYSFFLPATPFSYYPYYFMAKGTGIFGYECIHERIMLNDAIFFLFLSGNGPETLREI